MTVERTDPQAPDSRASAASSPTGPGAAHTALSEAERRAALAAGAPRMSRRVIGIGITALLAVGVAGALADHFATSGAPPSPVVHRSPTGPAGPAVPRHTATAPTAGEGLHAPLSAFMGLSTLHGAHATGFTLTDAATKAPVSLSSLAGHVVVLSFANAPCNDICPVLSREVAKADALLGRTAAPVTFLIVNTDPLALAPGDAEILTHTALGSLPNVRFLTGTLKALDPVWTTYGISITADRATRVVSHTNSLYFIGPTGTVAWTASPFANESASGTYALPATEISRFATGIAHYARKLADRS